MTRRGTLLSAGVVPVVQLLLERFLLDGQLLGELVSLIESLAEVTGIHRGEVIGKLFELLGGSFGFFRRPVSILSFEFSQTLTHRFVRLSRLLFCSLTRLVELFDLFLDLGQFGSQLFLFCRDIGLSGAVGGISLLSVLLVCSLVRWGLRWIRVWR